MELPINGRLLATVLATISDFLTIAGSAGPVRPGRDRFHAMAAKKKTTAKLPPGIPDHAVDQETLMRFFGPPIGRSTFYYLVRRGVIVKIKEVQGYYLLNESLVRLGLPRLRPPIPRAQLQPDPLPRIAQIPHRHLRGHRDRPSLGSSLHHPPRRRHRRHLPRLRPGRFPARPTQQPQSHCRLKLGTKPIHLSP